MTKSDKPEILESLKFLDRLLGLKVTNVVLDTTDAEEITFVLEFDDRLRLQFKEAYAFELLQEKSCAGSTAVTRSNS